MRNATRAELRGALLAALAVAAIGAMALRPGALTPAPRPVPVPVPAAAGAGATRIDLNRADARTLTRLPGIGPVLAERIVRHRARHGPFRSADELAAVRGIGPRLIERIGDRVTTRGRPDSLLR